MPELGIIDKLVFTITAGGQGVAAQSPTVIIQKQSNDYFFNGTGFTPTYTAIPMTEVDATNFPGKYSYDFNQALDTSITNGKETYTIRYLNTGTYALTVDEEITYEAIKFNTASATVSQGGVDFSGPGFQNPQHTYTVTHNNEKRLKAAFVNDNNVSFDPTQLTAEIYGPNRVLIYADTYPGTYIQRNSTGDYYIDFTNTDSTGEYTIMWSWRNSAGGEKFYNNQHLFVIGLEIVGLFPNLKNQIDKAQKDTGIFGFTDENLYYYLKGGLSEINRVPPATALTFSNFPLGTSSQLLIDISTFMALQSQGMCAIDTDMNYSMQGNSFVVDHWAKISAYLSFLNVRINDQLKQFKMRYLPGLSAKVEMGMGFRSFGIWNAAPPGVNFGNTLGTR